MTTFPQIKGPTQCNALKQAGNFTKVQRKTTALRYDITLVLKHPPSGIRFGVVHDSDCQYILIQGNGCIVLPSFWNH
jgi:hypothetical protein